MIKSLQNKTIWITGASSGVGEALVKELSKMDVNLIISARRQEELERVKSESSGNAQIEILTLDLTDSNSFKSKTTEANQLFGSIDILINNGGISQRSMVVDTNLEVDRRLMEVNYFGTIGLTKALLPSMLKNRNGHIVTITSLTGIFGTPWRSGYAASKHALHGFFDSMRAELEDEGIKVTLAALGFIRTNLSRMALLGDGSENGSIDETHQKGMDPHTCAVKIISAIEKEKREVYIGKESYAVYVKRFLPGLFARLIKKAKVR